MKKSKWLSILCIFGLFSCQAQTNTKTEQIFNTQNQIKNPNMERDTATFGAGCFWCVEAIFQQVNGVESVASGYSGGMTKDPDYKSICTGTTGHAEVCQIVYDPQVVSFDELLEIFWQTHDPTTLNRQGADVGTQYRSAVFYHNDFQRERAEYFKKKLNDENAFGKPVVTEVSPFTEFYKAEDYHQNYYNDNSNQGYCRLVIQPKLEKFEKAFKDKMKP